VGRTDEDDEAHREAAEAAHAVDEEELEQVVDGRVDPATALRHEDLPVVGRDRLRLGEARELELVLRKVLEDDRREVAILAERQEVLHEERGGGQRRPERERSVRRGRGDDDAP